MAFKDWLAQQEPEKNLASGTSEPLDTGEGTRPRLTFKEFLEQQKQQPQIEQETVEAAQQMPVGATEPTDTGSVVPAYTRAQQIAREESAKLGLSPYVTGNYSKPEPSVKTIADVAPVEPSLESKEAYKEWYREEGLPAAGMAVGGLLAPVTGGASFWASLGIGAAATGAGAFVGEAAEQTLKKEGIMQVGMDEEAPRNGWDILERSTLKAGQEAAIDAMGGLILRGVTHYGKELLRKTIKPRKTPDGKVINQKQEDLVALMREVALREGLEDNQVLLASQVAEVGLFDGLEDIAKASYVGSRPVEEVLERQRETITQEARQMVGDSLAGPKAFVAGAGDMPVDDKPFNLLSNYYKANMDYNTEFVVAGLVRKAFTSAQKQQKSVAKSIYSTIDQLANQTDMEQLVKEVPTQFFKSDGTPITMIEPLTKEVNRFPVRTQEIREWAADTMDESLLKADPILGELVGLPKEATMKQVSDAISDLKDRSRTLENAMTMGTAAENAPKRKRLIDMAISKMDEEYSKAVQAADAAGVRAPDGRSVGELKKEADMLWAKQTEDFQNDALINILKNTKLTNGAPEELVTQFLKSPSNAEKILNALDIGKNNLEGPELDAVFRAEQAIKGSIMERILLPVDALNKSYMSPDAALFNKNAKSIKMLLGDETYEATRRLVNASEMVDKATLSSTMQFAQKARESNMTIQAINAAASKDPQVLSRVSSTLMVALGAGKILTNPRNIKFAEALDDPSVSPAYKRRALKFLTEEFIYYQQAVADSMSPMDREQYNANMEERKKEEELSNVSR